MEVVMTTSLWSLTGGNKLRGRLYCRNLTIILLWLLMNCWYFTFYRCHGTLRLGPAIFWPVVSCLPLTDILYSEKLSREKTFMKFSP